MSVTRFFITELLDFKSFLEGLFILARMVLHLLALRALEFDHVILAHTSCC